jgi:Short C-terminal domain
MSRNLRVRTSPAASVIGGVVGLGFVFLGLFVAIPKFGMFGVFWTLVAVVITVAHLYNAFSSRGIANEIIEVSDEEPRAGADPEARLRKLDELRSKSLISDSEYEQRRSKILDQL